MHGDSNATPIAKEIARMTGGGNDAQDMTIGQTAHSHVTISHGPAETTSTSNSNTKTQPIKTINACRIAATGAIDRMLAQWIFVGEGLDPSRARVPKTVSVY